MSAKVKPFNFSMTPFAQVLDANDVPNPALIGPFKQSELSMKLAINYDDLVSYNNEDDGQLYDSIPTLEGIDVKMKIKAASSELLKLVMAATESTLAVGAGSVTGESITYLHDTWIKTDQDNISAVAITGFTEGADFLVDSENGAIMALSTGTMPDDTVQLTNYTHGTIDGIQLAAGTALGTYYRLFGQAVNRGNKEKGKLMIAKCRITTESDIYVSTAQETKELDLTIKPIKMAGFASSVLFNDKLLYG